MTATTETQLSKDLATARATLALATYQMDALNRSILTLESLGEHVPELAAAEAWTIARELEVLRGRVAILARSVANGDECLGDSGLAR